MNTPTEHDYIMESDEEAYRLDIKTVEGDVVKQAFWAGIKPGMSVADVSCGAGKTTQVLNRLVQPEGYAVGIDRSEQRLSYAKQNFHSPGIDFVAHDIRNPLGKLGLFDFVWVRFFLEYYRSTSFEIVQNIYSIVKPGGILCLIDLDYNCLSYFDIPSRLQETLSDLSVISQQKLDFDPYAGRKLYSHLYRLGCSDIKAEVSAHHLIYGHLNERDAYNWFKKMGMVAEKFEYAYERYEGGVEEFKEDFRRFFTDPARFAYTPLIAVRGMRPLK